MNTYRVYHAYSTAIGADEKLIGSYDTPSKDAALDAVCRDAGHRSLAHAAADAGETVEEYKRSFYVETVWSNEKSDVEKLARRLAANSADDPR